MRGWAGPLCWVAVLVCSSGCGDDDDGGGERGRDAARPPATVSPPEGGDRGSTVCSDDAACAGSKAGRLCDPWRHRCAECRAIRDCGAGERCIRGACTPETRCESSLDCSLGAVCDAKTDRCVECSRDRDCEDGFGCVGLTCAPRCDSDLDCTPARMLCDPDTGFCATPPGDAGTPATGGDGAVGAGGSGGGSGGAGDPVGSTCAITAAVKATHVAPTVMLVVDGSSSMETGFGPISDGGVAPPPPSVPLPGMPSRWSALRDALVDPSDGVLATLQSSVRFGLAVFGTSGSCPLPLGVIEPALQKAGAITAGLPQTPPGMFTPTGPALDMIVDRLPDPTASDVGAQVIVLITDGEPNACGGADIFAGIPMTDYGPSIAAAQKAQAKHIELLVVGLVVPGGMFQAHLQQLANIGAGLDPSANPGAASHFPEDSAALTVTLRMLIEAKLSCDFALDRGVKAGSECGGNVTLDGSALGCNDANGWSLLDATHIRLHGTACAMVKSSTAVLAADFPCAALQ